MGDTLGKWLYRRYGELRQETSWENLSPGDQAFWEHEAAAVRRAVGRGGFKIDSAASAYTPATPAHPNCMIEGGGQRDKTSADS